MPPVNDMVQKIAAHIVAGRAEEQPKDFDKITQEMFVTRYSVPGDVTLERRTVPYATSGAMWSVKHGDDSLFIYGNEKIVIEEAFEMFRLSQRDATAERILGALG